MGLKQTLVAGIVIFIGMIIATFIGGFVMSFIPIGGLIGTVISFLVMSLFIGFIVVWLLRKFAFVRLNSPGVPNWFYVRLMKSASYNWR